jgi:hypothetical protein
VERVLAQSVEWNTEEALRTLAAPSEGRVAESKVGDRSR